jgi:hypothetical protein
VATRSAGERSWPPGSESVLALYAGIRQRHVRETGLIEVADPSEVRLDGWTARDLLTQRLFAARPPLTWWPTNPAETDDLLRLGLHRLPIGEFPLLRGRAPVLADYDGAAEPERGLDILLKGLSSILAPQTAT